MASSARIVFEAVTPNGTKNFSYNYADEEATTQAVKAAAQALVTNGSIFTDVPSEIKSAKVIVTTTSDYDIQ